MDKSERGVVDQMMEEAKIEDYKGLTLERLTQFVKDISRSRKTSPHIEYPKLSKEEVKEYNKLIKKIKSGYLYLIEGTFVMTTGCKGAKDFLKVCKENNTPLLLVPTIWAIDDERGIMVRLEDITWTKVKTQVEDECSSNT